MKTRNALKDSMTTILISFGFIGSIIFGMRYIESDPIYHWHLVIYAIFFALLMIGLDIRYKS